MPKVIIDKWDGGIVNDPRTPIENVSRMCMNFDVFLDPYRLRPFRSAEDGNGSQTTQRIKNFCTGLLDNSNNYALFGLGVQSGATDAKIFYKALTDLADNTWTIPSANNNGEDGSGDPTAFNLFAYFPAFNKIYGTSNGTKIWAYVPSTDTFTSSDQALTYTNVTQGLVHSKEPKGFYFGYYYSGGGTPTNAVSAIAKNNGTSWNVTALSLPTSMRPRVLVGYKNYLAIGAEPVSGVVPGFGKSKVYLWDRQTTLNALSELIDWGEDRLFALGEINGTLVGVSLATGTAWFDNRLVFRYLNGSNAIKFAELVSSTPISISGNDPIQNINNRLTFMAGLTINGTLRTGIWSVEGTPGNFRIIHERSHDNDVLFDQDNDNLYSFRYVGDYLFQSYDDAGTFKMSKTESATAYSQKSVYETGINPNMKTSDKGKNKQLKAIRLTVEPIASGISTGVTLQYKVDGGSYIDIIQDFITEGTIEIERNQDATPSEFTSGREYEFNIESVGGVVPTRLEYEYEVLDTLL